MPYINRKSRNNFLWEISNEYRMTYEIEEVWRPKLQRIGDSTIMDTLIAAYINKKIAKETLEMINKNVFGPYGKFNETVMDILSKGTNAVIEGVQNAASKHEAAGTTKKWGEGIAIAKGVLNIVTKLKIAQNEKLVALEKPAVCLLSAVFLLSKNISHAWR